LPISALITGMTLPLDHTNLPIADSIASDLLSVVEYLRVAKPSSHTDVEPMIILSVHDGHDAGACLLRDGEVVLYSAEERRRNLKNYAGVPTKSLEELFRQTGISPDEVDAIALCDRIRTMTPTRTESPLKSVLRAFYFLGQTELTTRLGQWVLARLRKRKALLEQLERMGLGDTPVTAYDHHLCHAATAYYHRPWSDDALVLTLDGAGDGLCATVSVGRDFELQTIARTPKFHSPAAWFYSAVTAHLGLRPYEHEYKVMGMAPYGRAEFCAPLLRKCFDVEGLRFRNRTGRNGPSIQAYYHRLLAGQRFDNVAAACQLVFEELMVKWVGNAIRETGIHRVACAGGAFLNVKANKLIRELPETESLYVYPASDDGGTPIGAAILGYLDLCRKNNAEPTMSLPQDMYLGFEHDEAEMEQAVKDAGVEYHRMEKPADEIAALLADQKVVARFNGREEIGPRALGNRSILADPRDLKVVRKLNFAIKQRDFWMPFAASMLKEDAEEYICGLSAWPYYMIEAFDTRGEAEEAFISAMHPFDLTVRPQLVDGRNESYREILTAFKERTGVGVLLNTSFNLHGFPIVGSPAVAVRTLMDSGLDALALGPFLAQKNG
jgi:carbamoyltransferase